MFAQDLARFFLLADLAMSERKILRYLMHGFKEKLCTGLVPNTPRTVKYFVKEATAIERTRTSAGGSTTEWPAAHLATLQLLRTTKTSTPDRFGPAGRYK